MNASDADRAARHSLGDSSGRRELVIEYGRLVLGICVHLAQDPEQAFRAIWRQVFAELSAWERSAPLERWIATQAHRHLLGTSGRPAAGTVVQLGERGPRPTQPVRSSIEAADVGRILAMLPVERRRVVVLRHLARLPAASIAATERVAVAAVEAHLHRGRAFVARRLVDDRPPWEELSALLEGDLPPDDRAEIEERVASEPDLTQAYHDLRSVVAALDHLERPAVPAALLDDVAASSTKGLLPSLNAWPWLVAVLAAAIAVTLALRAQPVVQANLDAGVHELGGRVRVNGAVVLDGRARIAIDADGNVTVHVHEGHAVVGGRRVEAGEEATAVSTARPPAP